MTKWFNTNYQYLVPVIYPDTTFKLNADKPASEYQEAKDQDIETKPVIIGPVTLLLLSKSPINTYRTLSKLDDLLEIYKELLASLHKKGVQWIQLDEPWLIMGLNNESRKANQKFADCIHPA